MIQQVYKNQTALQIKILTGIPLTNVSTIPGSEDVKIKYKKPAVAGVSETGHWVGRVDNAELGSIYYDVQDPDELDIAGEWTLWPHITFLDGRSAPGSTVKMQVIEEGSN